MSWLEAIPWGDKLVPDLVLYAASMLGFALLPAHFGKKVWILLGWFICINVLFLLGLPYMPDWGGPWIFAALGQIPWILYVLSIFLGGRLSAEVASVPMRELILWQIARIMGLHFVLAIYGGYAPQEFALQIGFSEMVTALGALALYVINRPNRGWYRTMLVFWNTYGLTSVIAADYRTLLSNPQIPFASMSREIFQYMASYPQSWLYCFWFPFSIAMHAAVFHKMYFQRASARS